jgi:hypothetical protein
VAVHANSHQLSIRLCRHFAAGWPYTQTHISCRFGCVATLLLALALLAGLAIVLTRLRRRRVPGLLIGIHAMIAVSGVVILAAYALVGFLAVPG